MRETTQTSAKRIAKVGPQRAQPWIVSIAALFTAGGTAWLTEDYGLRHGTLLLVGAALGMVLYHARFGFTGAFRSFIATGDGSGIRAQMLMLALATLLFAPMLAFSEVLGSPVGGAVAPASVSVLVGAFIFAIGMQLSGA